MPLGHASNGHGGQGHLPCTVVSWYVSLASESAGLLSSQEPRYIVTPTAGCLRESG